MDSEKQQTLTDIVASVMSETSDSDVSALNENYTCLNTRYDQDDSTPAKLMKIRKYQLHAKTYSAKWELDPNYRGWVQRSQRGDGFFFCLACNQDYTCGKSELDKHASSKKHCLNIRSLPKMNDFNLAHSNNFCKKIKSDETVEFNNVLPNDFDASSTSNNEFVFDSKEESFGKYIVSELKRIKKKKTYELVKWEILQALQKAMLKEIETEDSED
ncbi:hypothetical protein PGB90_004889 [Kerria lacca]